MKLTNFVIVICICALCFAEMKEDCRTIRPLAGDGKVLYKTPNPNDTYIYDPGIAVCPNGRLIGCFSLGGSGASKVDALKGSGNGRVYTSDDGGENWTYRNNFPMSHFRPFVAGNRLYILGQRGNLRVIASDDWGTTWSEPVEITKDEKWHGSATNVWYKGDCVYMVMETYARNDMKSGWRVAELAPVLLRGNIKTDLTKSENWTFASKLAYADVVNDKELDWFGVPFYDGYYPVVKRNIRGRSSFHPIGWLEANVVQIVDPKHYWYDPTGNTFHIFLRAHTGITNMACVIKAVEQEDGTIKTMLQKAPSGKTQLYLPFPGGEMKFSVVYDERSKLYWMVSTQPTDSMTRLDQLPDERYCLGDNERRRLVLHFSKNMVDWCFAGLVAIGPSERSSRHYCQMVIGGDDLLIMSRSGDLESKDAHNGNIATFHKVEDFRDLIY